MTGKALDVDEALFLANLELLRQHWEAERDAWRARRKARVGSAEQP